MRWLRRLRARLKYRRFDAELREGITGVVRDSRYTTPSAVRPLFHSAPELSASVVLFRMDRRGAAAELRAIVQSIEPRLRLTIAPVTVEERRREIGVRLALGARSRGHPGALRPQPLVDWRRARRRLGAVGRGGTRP